MLDGEYTKINKFNCGSQATQLYVVIEILLLLKTS